jgi:uncharacterized protein YggU (UPF0235/DUF167 family)
MYIHVKAHAGAKKEKITKKSDDHFEVWVRVPAERNMANGRIVALIAKAFGVGVESIRIINGHHSPSKILDVEV